MNLACLTMVVSFGVGLILMLVGIWRHPSGHSQCTKNTRENLAANQPGKPQRP